MGWGSCGGWWQEWFSAAGVLFRLPLTSTVTSDLNLTGRHALQKAPTLLRTVCWRWEGAVPGRASQIHCYFPCGPKDTPKRRTITTTKQQPVQSLPSWKYMPESRTLHFCPHSGAKWVSAKILVCLPSLLVEPTSADATGMLLSEAPVLPRWQKLWIIASVHGTPA